MTILCIPDMGKFLNLVEKSQGAVMLHLSDGSQLDLKQSHDARQILRLMEPRQAGLDISLSSSKDTQAFARYMMEARRDLICSS